MVNRQKKEKEKMCAKEGNCSPRDLKFSIRHILGWQGPTKQGAAGPQMNICAHKLSVSWDLFPCGSCTKCCYEPISLLSSFQIPFYVSFNSTSQSPTRHLA
jgi:hypothetical protein